MKKVCWAGLAILFGLFSATSIARLPALGADDNPGGDLTLSVTVSAAPGDLKFHGRNETQYRDMNPGAQSLASGSFLKTGGGTADLVLDDNSVLCLDVNTEVQVGLYHNGVLVVQRSGRACHLVEPREGTRYAVQTPYYTATAVGTEYRTTLNYPVEGAVTVEWGEVEIVLQERDPATGETRDVYGFVPQGHMIVWPPDPAEPERLRAGEHEVFHAGQGQPARVVGRKTTPPAADAWTGRMGNLGRFLRDLRRRYYEGRINPREYGQKLHEALGIGPGSWPGRPGPQLGGLWIGNAGDIFTIRFCLSGNTISDIRIKDEWQGTDKETHEVFQHFVNLTFPGSHFIVERDGRVEGFTAISDADNLWKGASIQLRGFLGGRTGRFFINVTSETDVAVYLGICMIVEVRLVDPNGCNY